MSPRAPFRVRIAWRIRAKRRYAPGIVALVVLSTCVLTARPVVARPMTATDLVTMHRIGAPALSIDSRWVAWHQSETDLTANETSSALWLLDLNREGATPQRLTAAGHDAVNPRFSRDGQWIYFLSNASGRNQLWRVSIVGGHAQQMAQYDYDVTDFLLSPDGEQVAIRVEAPISCGELPCRLPEPAVDCCGSGRIYERLPVRQGDSWRAVQTRSHIYVPHRKVWMAPEIRSRVYVLPLAGGNARSVQGRLLGDMPASSQRVSGHMAWDRDSSTLFFTLREAHELEALSTNYDIFAAAVQDGTEPVNLTKASIEADVLPVVSPDGSQLAYAARVADDPAARLTLHVRDLVTGSVRSVAPTWNVSVESISWVSDARSLLVTAREGLDRPLYRVSLRDGHVTRLITQGNVTGVLPTIHGDAIVSLESTLTPADLYRVSPTGELTRLTNMNGERLTEIDVPLPQRFSFSGPDNEMRAGWLLAPRQAGRKLPTVLLVHDERDDGVVSAWSSAWSSAVLAAAGYAVLAIDLQRTVRDRPATTGRSQNDLPSRLRENLKFTLSAAASTFPSIDASNMCAAGAGAFAGHSVLWIEGDSLRLFKCLIAYAGVFDTRTMAYETDDPARYESQYAGAAALESTNPITRVRSWATPLLLFHGEHDSRVPYTQSIGAFTAAQSRHVPARLVIFPDEGHWIEKPKNTIQWYGELLNWLGTWLPMAED